MKEFEVFISTPANHAERADTFSAGVRPAPILAMQKPLDIGGGHGPRPAPVPLPPDPKGK